MPEMTIVAIINLSLLLFTSKLLEDVFRKTGFPSFLGSIIAGILLGPGVLNIINQEHLEYLTIFFIIGINFLLFLAGAEEVGDIIGMKIESRVIFLTLLTFILNIFVLYLFSLIFKIISYEMALALGLIFGIIDMGPLVKGLLEARKLGTKEGLLLTKIALLTEVSGIILFDFVLIKHVTIYAILIAIGNIIIFFVIIVVFGHYILVPFLKYIDLNFRAYEATFASIISIVLLFSYLGELVGVPSPIISLMIGSYLSKFLRARPEQLERIKAFSMGFFEPLFFAGIGVYVTILNLDLIIMACILVLFFSIPKILIGLLITRNRLILSLLSKGGISGALLLILLTKYATLSEYVYSTLIIAMLIMTIISSFAYIEMKGKEKAEIICPKISEIMDEPEFVYGYEKLAEIASKLTKTNEIIVVNDELKPIGLLTTMDLVYISPRHFDTIRVEDIMRTPSITINKDSVLRDLIELVFDTNAEIIAVVDEDDKLVGIVRIRKVLSEILKHARRMGIKE